MKLPARSVRVPAVVLATLGLCGVAWSQLWLRAEDSWPVLFLLLIYFAIEIVTLRKES
jgi:hypothetical protein